MREVAVSIWCDRHQARDGEKVVADGRSIGFDGKHYLLDLCQGCTDELIQPLRDLVEEYGQPDTEKAKRTRPSSSAGVRKGKPPAGSRDFKCFWCPADFAGESGFSRHAVTIHGVGDGRGSVRAIYGSRCPMCGVDDVHYLATHARREHDLGGIPALFDAAETAGDVHGVIAERKALA